MNIFRILNSGNGIVSETNVSAFLAYLLNPYEDHGLKDHFLKLILNDVIKENSIQDFDVNNKNKRGTGIRFKDLVLNEDYFIEIKLEQPFVGIIDDIKDDDSKRIVDIIIIIHKKVQNSAVPFDTAINRCPIIGILIENKTVSKPTKDQIKHQYLLAKSMINATKNLQNLYIYPLYITPTGKLYDEEWESWEKWIKKEPGGEILGKHLLWSQSNKATLEFIKEFIEKYPNVVETNSENSTVVLGMLEALLKKEALGKIEPWTEISRHTIKSFIDFIKSGFTKNNNVSRYCSRFEFYKYCLDKGIRNADQLKAILNVEEELPAKFENMEVRIEYSIGKKPMIVFYLIDISTIRIELDGEDNNLQIRKNIFLNTKTWHKKIEYLDTEYLWDELIARRIKLKI